MGLEPEATGRPHRDDLDLELGGKLVRLRAMIVARKTTAGAWEVVALQYGADSEFGDPPD